MTRHDPDEVQIMTVSPPGTSPAAKPVKCADCALRKNDAFRDFTDKELCFVEGLKHGELVVQPGATIFLEGQNSAHLFTILSGWVFRYKMMEDGRRQILNFGLPGDLIGLQTYVFNELDHSIEALTEVVLCVFPREKVWEIYRDFPELGFDLTWLAAKSEHLLDNNLLSVGRMTAKERVAHALLQMYDRLDQLGMAKGNSIELPITQNQLSDALGLSHVHTNKTLKKLTDEGLLEWSVPRLKIVDRDRLAEIASYDVEALPERPFI